jgi:hypothetical protein
MHAGDGNVHTNIPVNSDDYEMLQAAHGAVKRIMVLARSLDGVISGEHGIGITKLEFLSDAELAPFTDYKARIDPEGRFNKGKLLRIVKSTKPRTGKALEANFIIKFRFNQCLYTQLWTHGARIAHHAAKRHWCHCRQCQGLPALWQMQTCLQHPRAARQFAVQPTQQDSGHLFVGRGLSCTRSKRAVVSASNTGRSLKTWPTTARCATNVVAMPGEHRLW